MKNQNKINHNPDVLSCLANLSSDEVFTSPQLANDMLDLLPPEIWKDKNAKFLDPACKTGIFLREITKRLIIGLETEFPDLQERINHILKNQVYGIAITDLTSLISRRTLYCSKEANGEYSICNIFLDEDGNLKYKNLEHTFKNGNCIFCGASELEYKRSDDLETYAYEFIHSDLEELKKMKFDVIISNPPYQLSDGLGGNGTSAIPLYNKFIDQAIKLNPKHLVMIIPSRWYSGGKGLKEFRKKMISDKRIHVMHDFIDASDCFPGVEIKGGVCYFLWSKKYNGKCMFYTHENNTITSCSERYLEEDGIDVIIRYNEAIPILNKVKAVNAEQKWFSCIVQSRKPFGLNSSFKNYKKTPLSCSVKIYANKEIGYLPNNFIIPKNSEWTFKYKVYVSKAFGNGCYKYDRLKPILGKPNTICTETYLMVGPFENERQAINVVNYMNTNFFHFMLGLVKNTQNTSSSTYSLIPLQDLNEEWTDEKLYKKYNLTDEEIQFIESMIKPM